MYFYLVNNQIFIIRTSNENKIKLLQCEIIVKKISTNVRLISKTCLSLQRKFKIKSGGLAHLARARHWQCRGDRFESGNLHKTPLNARQEKGLRILKVKNGSVSGQ